MTENSSIFVIFSSVGKALQSSRGIGSVATLQFILFASSFLGKFHFFFTLSDIIKGFPEVDKTISLATGTENLTI